VPITPFLNDGIKEAIAEKLIALAKTGERTPDILCEEVLKDIGRPQQWTASEAARSSTLRELCAKVDDGMKE
jgi:hypothetical protein